MGVPRRKLHVIPYGAELDQLQTSTESPRGSVNDSFNILFAGAVSLRKGVPYLLEAFAQLKAPGKRLRLAGSIDPDIKQVLGKFATDGVEILGPLSRTELTALMRDSDVLVLPSIEDGFGLVMAEAMACGCTIISSTNTGGSDLYSDGAEGFIVPIRDPAVISERLEQLADDRDLLARMKIAARAKVNQIGGWSEYGDRWVSLLQGLTGKT
jgi:glycosyltransferase involved in cell wall biosynthesis